MDTRQHILEAAERMIQEKGLAKVTTREIARAAGCADGTLYVHFPHKEDVFLAVLQEQLQAFTTPLQVAQVGQATVEENLEAMAHAALTFYETIVPLTAALFGDQELLERHRNAVSMQGKGPQNGYQYIATYIRGEQERGRVNAQASPEGVAILLLGACFQYIFFSLFLGKEPLPQSRQQFVKDLIRTLMGGLTP